MRSIIRYILLFLLATLMLTGCRLFHKKNKLPEAHAEKQVAAQVQQLLAVSDSTIQISGTDLETGIALRSFYKAREAKPAWVDKPGLADELLNVLSHASYYGLDSTEYHVPELRTLMSEIKAADDDEQKHKLFAQADIMLTDAYFVFAFHLQHGRLDPSTLERKPVIVDAELAAHLEKALKRNHIEKSFEELEPQQADYVMLRKAMKQYLSSVKLSDDTTAVPDPKKDSAACYAIVRNVLVAQHYLDTTKQQSDTSVTAALRVFQQQHGLEPDGRAGANTREALRTSTRDRYEQIAVNLERWRWQNDWGRQYVFVNIPAYHLKVMESDRKAMELRVIVGKPTNQTPEVSSKIENMITNPFWHVPESIYSKELLPELQANPSEYLAKHAYKVFDRNNNLVDPSSVNWSDAKGYRIRQEAGDQNALGRIKFNFQNKFQVYLHDTPSRSLFKKETRSLSHGCVRVQDPVALAGYLLKNDHSSYSKEDIQSLISKGQNRHIALKQQVPIHIRYFTCEADNNGNVYFYRDVYKKDEAIKDKLFGE